jgi:hypothetical protein
VKYLGLAAKVLIFLGLLSGVYLFGYLRPHQAKIKEASSHYSNLVENRAAYIDLAKLNPSSPDFNTQKSNLIDIVRQTNAKGLSNPLTSDEKSIFERQNEILAEVFATGSYQEGVAILKGEESVQLLVDEARLIEAYKIWNEVYRKP